jgi:hypothetical protein
MGNTGLLTTTFTGLTITCPAGNPNCTGFSNPVLANDLLWQNRAFQIGVGIAGTGTQNQQNMVALYNASFNRTSVGPATVSQTSTGSCNDPGASYWEIGVRGDTGPTNHSSGFTLAPTWSVLTDATDYPGANNLGSNPTVVAQYCNGARVPPECTVANGCVSGAGWAVPPGIADAVVPNPVFSLTPAATVDEGNNWINVTWGPLELTNDAVMGGAYGDYGGGAPLGNYALAAGSPAIDYIPVAQPHVSTDFFGNPRPDPSSPTGFDVGAVEFQGAGVSAPVLSTIAPNSGGRNTSVPVTLTGTNLSGVTAVNVSGTGVTVSAVNVVNPTTVTATFTISGTAGLTARNVTVVSAGGTSNAVTFTVAAPTVTGVSPNTGLRGTAVPVTITGTGLGSATGVTVSGTGVTVSNFTRVNATTVTATFTVAITAGTTARTVTVQTPSGNAARAAAFTVVAPTLTSIAPNIGHRGTSVGVTLTGTNLAGTTSIVVSGTGVTVSNLSVVNSTTVTATFNITTTAALTVRNVHTVSTTNGNSNNVAFTVQP